MIQAGLQALEEFGAGLSSTRFICGTQVHSGCCGGWGGVPCPQRGALTPIACFHSQQGWFSQLSSPQGPRALSLQLYTRKASQASVRCKRNSLSAPPFPHLHAKMLPTEPGT